jgi:F-box protein 9
VTIPRHDVSKNESALEVYETGVMKERQGSLSEAIIHYRRALKMDPDVDKHYKQKYFPTDGRVASIVKQHPDEVHSGYSIQEYNPHHHDSDLISSITDSMESLSLIKIEAEDPEKECYLSTLPDEILLNILVQLALSSLASLSRISQTCKKLFLLAQGENSLYKELCIYYFSPFDSPTVLQSRLSEYKDWHSMLIERPRLRFDGCYIATCHYLRPGVNDYSWNTPIHMVTYFRFVRFYPDGTCITVLTTLEPKEVVHSVSWTGSVGLKGVSEGIWRMSETGRVMIEVRGPRDYTFIKDLQVLSWRCGLMYRLRVLREGSIINLFGWDLILSIRLMEKKR